MSGAKEIPVQELNVGQLNQLSQQLEQVKHCICLHADVMVCVCQTAYLLETLKRISDMLGRQPLSRQPLFCSGVFMLRSLHLIEV